MCKILLSILLFLFGLGSLRAQSLQSFKEALAKPITPSQSDSLVISTTPATVVVVENADAVAVVEQAHRRNTKYRFKGWRVCIFSDNSQGAHEGSLAAKTSFRSLFPGINIYNSYDTPYFKVTVGDCLTMEEAIILYERARITFPQAFIKQETLSLANLVR
ncbi:MAG: hypothetical protein RR037_05050 [Alistipes sp.]